MVDENKSNILLAGPCLGELYWEAGRFFPYVLMKKRQLSKKYGKVKLVVITRKDRYDIYGNHADEFIDLNQYLSTGNNYIQDCFRLINFPYKQYQKIISKIASQYKPVEHIYPDIKPGQFCNKKQFKHKDVVFENIFDVRSENKRLVDELLQNCKNKKIVTLAPRFRKDIKERNWNHWSRLYDLLYSNLSQNYTFVICGRAPDYVPDERFFDINKIKIDSEKCSLFGLTIEVIKRSILTVGSQSAIPNISLLLKVPVLEWGNQKYLHTVSYNHLNTPCKFIDDMYFDKSPDIIFKELVNLLKKL